MKPPPVLAVHELSLALSSGSGPRPLVTNVNLTLDRGRILGLIGESGCGKSLTCLAVMGLLPGNIRRSEGTIMVAGQALDTLPAEGLRAMRGRSVAMILQNPMSCFDAVFKIRCHFEETLASHNRDRKGFQLAEVQAALTEVGFENPAKILDLYPFQMSGGMLQRVMVALALMMDVPLLIADEPTTDLDVVSQTRILDLLERMRITHDVAILLVTHDLSVIARLADDVAIMKDGRLVETGTVAGIFNGCRHPYTKALLQAHLSLYGPELDRLRTDDTLPGALFLDATA